MSTWSLLFTALGLAMLLEGLPYFVSPRGVRWYFEQLSRQSDRAMRSVGLGLMAAGLVVAYFSLH